MSQACSALAPCAHSCLMLKCSAFPAPVGNNIPLHKLASTLRVVLRSSPKSWAVPQPSCDTCWGICMSSESCCVGVPHLGWNVLGSLRALGDLPSSLTSSSMSISIPIIFLHPFTDASFLWPPLFKRAYRKGGAIFPHFPCCVKPGAGG